MTEATAAPSLCVIPGDGIGLEVVPAAVRVLQAALPSLHLVQAEAGWNCFQKRGHSAPPETLQLIRDCGAALFGAVSSPAGPVPGYHSAIVAMRRELDLYANVRPVRSLPHVSPRADVDLIVVRENSEGLYAGRERRLGDTAVAERVVSARASRRIARRACRLARCLGRKRLTIVHKANVLPLSDGLFRETVHQVAAEMAGDDGYPLQVDDLLADTAMLQMVGDPRRFDVVVTTNLFGDLLSDAAAHWGGGIGLAPSLNWGDGLALAEPVHGSAPDIAGRGLANPIAAILSAALLARFAWDRDDVARAIEAAVLSALQADRTLLQPRAGLTARVRDAILAHLE